MAGKKKKKKSKYHRPLGRPSKLTPGLQAKLCAWMTAGNTFEDACAAVGIVTAAAREWLRRGARELDRMGAGDQPNRDEAGYAEFARKIELAMANPKAKAVAQLTRAGDEDWRAALAYLERVHPKQYGRQVNVNVREELDAFLDTLEKRLSPEEYARVVAAALGSADEAAPETADGALADQHED